MTAILDKARVAFAFILVGFAIGSLLGNHFIFKGYADHKDDGTKALMRSIDKDTPFSVFQSYPTRFEFYGERQVDNLGKRKFVEFLQTSNGTALFATKSVNIKKLKRFLKKHPEMNLELDDVLELTKSGEVFSSGKAVINISSEQASESSL